ncbi:N-acetyl-D-glucosamine kinase [Populus alba x Populus x berolinensis]|uniref:N-acetyl-D-glucosamine kinase n=1 Tax=Populus alba x Populus x berolinensis TaxID=444605 RepID=A0AAD6M7V8_9ROSI|nr:N-acetyl-D-glucosamine kinase [Populus alba x Populus x berolinensis]
MNNYGESNGDSNVHEKQVEGHDHCENGDGSDNRVILGIDGGTTSTVCVCIPLFSSSKSLPNPTPILGRAVSGCSNHNSVGEIFPSHVKLYVQNDAVAALASGTMGKLHGCVLIAGTGCISYGFAEDGREARASGAGPVLGDWGSGYGIAAKALTAVIRAHDGRGPQTMLTNKILKALSLSSPDELIGWTYADPSWARIAALVPEVVSCAEACDQVATKILVDAVQDLALSVKAVVQRLHLCGEDGNGSFPVVMVGGVLEANRTWDIGKEVMKCIQEQFPGAHPIRPQVEPAVGAALLAWNFLMKESTGNSHS